MIFIYNFNPDKEYFCRSLLLHWSLVILINGNLSPFIWKFHSEKRYIFSYWEVACENIPNFRIIIFVRLLCIFLALLVSFNTFWNLILYILPLLYMYIHNIISVLYMGYIIKSYFFVIIFNYKSTTTKIYSAWFGQILLPTGITSTFCKVLD